ncbi:MAG: hypothetical protein QOH09_3068 [Pseudonocardiales bacterium]|nr:hypothetical protein [Pseudonocardiales bacterium]
MKSRLAIGLTGYPWPADRAVRGIGRRFAGSCLARLVWARFAVEPSGLRYRAASGSSRRCSSVVSVWISRVSSVLVLSSSSCSMKS